VIGEREKGAAPRAVVLLSGGIDSTTTLAVASAKGHRTFALTVDYNQRHRCELQAARRVAEVLGCAAHLVIPLDLRVIGGSALTDDAEVPKAGPRAQGIPVTYVPARNTIFLSLALAWAEVLGAWDIFIGANIRDYSGYPDCRPEYLEAFEKTANLATAAPVEGRGRFHIRAPLIGKSKSEIIRMGVSLGVDYSLTHSCYDPGPQGLACGRCDSCRFRLNGFAEAGLKDPIAYAG
jgi:7-cyano-7-deazaguanine synthase